MYDRDMQRMISNGQSIIGSQSNKYLPAKDYRRYQEMQTDFGTSSFNQSLPRNDLERLYDAWRLPQSPSRGVDLSPSEYLYRTPAI